MRKLFLPFWILILAVVLAACKPTPSPIPSPGATIPSTSTPTAPPTLTPTLPATATQAPTSAPTATPVTSCPGAPPLTLKPGDWAVVGTNPPLPNKVRSQAGIAGELIGQIQPGENVQVLEGPACADGYAWWHVRSLAGLEGWTVEGDAAGYWLVDPISVWSPLPGPLQSRGIKTYSLRELTISADLALVTGITGSYLPLATPMPTPQNEQTPEPEDPRGNIAFGIPNHAAHSDYKLDGLLEYASLTVYDLTDPLSRLYINRMREEDCTLALKKTLEQDPITAASIQPFCGDSTKLPLHFVAAIQPIQFSGGKGVRFLISSANYLTVNDLYYVFEGLSDDGRYYLRGHFRPINHPYIVDAVTLQNDFGPLLGWKKGQYEAASASYQRFNTRIEQMLEAGALPLYPSPDFLDEMLKSIVVK